MNSLVYSYGLDQKQSSPAPFASPRYFFFPAPSVSLGSRISDSAAAAPPSPSPNVSAAAASPSPSPNVSAAAASPSPSVSVAAAASPSPSVSVAAAPPSSPHRRCPGPCSASPPTSPPTTTAATTTVLSKARVRRGGRAASSRSQKGARGPPSIRLAQICVAKSSSGPSPATKTRASGNWQGPRASLPRSRSCLLRSCCAAKSCEEHHQITPPLLWTGCGSIDQNSSHGGRSRVEASHPFNRHQSPLSF